LDSPEGSGKGFKVQGTRKNKKEKLFSSYALRLMTQSAKRRAQSVW